MTAETTSIPYTWYCPRCWSNPCQCTSQQTWWPHYHYWPAPCEHCYCKRAEHHLGSGPHRQCCKCGTTMASRFLTKK